MADQSIFKTLQDAYVQKKLGDDFYWKDLVSNVQAVVNGGIRYLRAPSYLDASTGTNEPALKAVCKDGSQWSALSEKTIQKNGQSFDFTIKLTLDSGPSDNDRVSETLWIPANARSPERNVIEFTLGNPGEIMLIDLRDPSQFYEVLVELLTLEVSKPIG